MTRHGEFLEAFMPSFRMALLTGFCFSIGSAREDREGTIAESGYTYEALKARILNGPSALSIADKLVYFAVLAVALEVFNYISIHLGGKLYSC